MTRSTASSRFGGSPAVRLTVLMSARDKAGHRSLVVELLRRAARARLAGATVFEGASGYGSSGRIHRPHVMSNDRPLAAVFVDRPERIDRFLAEAADLLHDVLTIADEVEMVDFGESGFADG